MLTLVDITTDPVTPIPAMTRRQTALGPALITSIDPENQIVRVTIDGWGDDAIADPGLLGAAFLELPA